MNLDDAIAHCKEVAESTTCIDCKNEHLQLAVWLLELKKRRSEKMAKNLIPKIAELLDLKLGEEFIIGEDKFSNRFFHFTEYGVSARDISGKNIVLGREDAAILKKLILGSCELIKIPWRPLVGDAYWTFTIFENDTLNVSCNYWDFMNSSICDFALLKAGWVFRTKEEAQTALPKVAKEIGLNYRIK